MDIKLLVQIPGTNVFRAVALSCSGTVNGADCQLALRQLFAAPTACWQVQGTPLGTQTLGKAPLLDGAQLTCDVSLYPSKQQESSASDSRSESRAGTVLTLQVLHGPDSFQNFPLSRGRWAIGRHTKDITLADPALGTIEADLEVFHSKLICRTGSQTTEVAVGVPFWLGNSLLSLEEGPQQPPVPATAWALEDLEIDIPARRNPWLLIAMMMFPLLIGLTIALITKMWLILIMAVGSSLLMAVHALASGGESKKTRQLIEDTAQQQLEEARNPPTSIVKSDQVLLGTLRTSARIRGKHRDIDRIPLLDAVPYAVSLKELLASPAVLPVETLRLLLAQLPHLYSPLQVLLTEQDPPLYRVLVEPLLSLPTVSVLRPGQEPTLASLTIATVEAKNLAYPAGTPLLYISPQTAQTAYRESCPPSPNEALYPQLDGISETTYRALINNIATPGSDSPQAPATRTTDIPDFAFPQRYPPTDQEDITFFLGTDTETGAPLRYGLNRNGPHFLCAGTTGAGKSQLLRSLLWSAALGASPSRLSLVLIDFKGGAGLGPLASLPHCKALISDLDSSGLTRALKYLRADLKKREHHFQTLGVPSYSAYRQHCTNTDQEPAYPEILICIDEFRMLVDDYPDIMTEFMRIATVGRSLGYHLILATQRPQGAISQDIRANIATSICLRVGSVQDSFNVISAEDAAHIPAGTPGSGYIRDSDQHLTRFQAPLIDGYYAQWNGIISARFISNCESIHFTDLVSPQDFDDTELVQACARVARAHPPTSYTPIPPIPQPVTPLAPQQKKTPSLALGTVELPECGLQTPWMWKAEDGACLLLGTLTERSEHVLTALATALYAGYELVCISSSEQFAQNLAKIYPAASAPCTVYSLKDLDFIRNLLSTLATGSSSPVFLLIDGLDSFLELLHRYPETEAHLHELLMPLGDTPAAVYCTSATTPRGKFGQLFAHTLLTPGFLSNDPIRSHQKDYNFPSVGAFALEGILPQTLSEGTVSAGILYPVQRPTTGSGMGRPSPGYQQLPMAVSLDTVLSAPGLSSAERPICGMSRHSLIELPQLTGGCMAISGSRGSGKSNLLKILSRLSPGVPSILLQSSHSTTLEDIQKMIEKAQTSPVLPQLLIDDLQFLSSDAQHLILHHKTSFKRILVAYTPWPRWSASPLLAALSGTETGIVLRPESLADLSFYSATAMPLDLKTQGRTPPGRGLLLDRGELIPFQVPLHKS